MVKFKVIKLNSAIQPQEVTIKLSDKKQVSLWSDLNDELFSEKDIGKEFSMPITECQGGYGIESKYEEKLEKRIEKKLRSRKNNRKYNKILRDCNIPKISPSDQKRQAMIHPWESPVRSIIAKTEKGKYFPLKNLEEARKYQNSYLVMEGDSGGTIYLSIPVDKIKCNEKALRSLLTEIDELVWNMPQDSAMFFERYKDGSGISGGMGGGYADTKLWVHKEIQIHYDKIKEVLESKRKSIFSSKFSRLISRVRKMYGTKVPKG